MWQAEAMSFRGKELSDAYQAKRDLEEKEKVMGDIQNAMNSKDVSALGKAIKEAERLNVDEVCMYMCRAECRVLFLLKMSIIVMVRGVVLSPSAVLCYVAVQYESYGNVWRCCVVLSVVFCCGLIR